MNVRIPAGPPCQNACCDAAIGFRDSPRFRFVHGNVTARELTANKIGAAGGVQMVVDHPAGAIQNFPGTEVLLELAAGGRKRLLIGST